jgi:hypothetical protein
MTISLVSISMWQAGYFTGNGVTGVTGFGTYRMNLCSLFDSNGIFSYLLADIPTTDEEWEGFNFLGSGVVFLIFSGVLTYLLKKINGSSFLTRPTISAPLIVACSFLTLFALSNKIFFSEWEILAIPLPESIITLCNIFRGSGRFFWPVYYLIVIYTISFSIANYRPKVAATMLGIAILLQAGDSPLIIGKVKKIFDGENTKLWETPLKDPAWELFAKRYKNIRIVTPGNNVPNWIPLGYFAATHGMAINCGYFARVNNNEMAREQQLVQSSIDNENLFHDSLYIFNDIDMYRHVSDGLPAKDLHGIFNGLSVIAPNWF